MAPRAILATLLFLLLAAVACAAADLNIATFLDTNGEMLGPFIVKPLHSHEDSDSPIAAPLGSDYEGSGEDYNNNDVHDDTEGGDDSDGGLLIDTFNENNNVELYAANSMDTNIQSPDIIIPVENINNEAITSDSLVTSPTSTQAVSTSAKTEEVTIASSTSSSTADAILQSSTPVGESDNSEVTMESNDPVCHDTCVSLLHTVTLRASPNVTLIREGDSTVLTCQIAITDVTKAFQFEDIQLQWVFEGENPPASECSLDQQEYLSACTGFKNVHDWQDRNTTHLTTALTLTQLQEHNTGRYRCQAQAHCCGEVLQHQLQHRMVVWQANYTMELILMVTVVAALTSLLVAGLVYKRKRQALLEYNYAQVVLLPAKHSTQAKGGGSKVIHMPLQQDDSDAASFSSFEEDAAAAARV